MQQQDLGAKAIVFSQFVNMLDVSSVNCAFIIFACKNFEASENNAVVTTLL